MEGGLGRREGRWRLPSTRPVRGKAVAGCIFSADTSQALGGLGPCKICRSGILVNNEQAR
ncbi:hypothetical protein AMD24_00144 [Candidatus Xiphinematobacter sp. Idaho Grape]|nr:hypothetical protein AMD24_00144 [Candidatus Xiphinematobacter sp. Idaho Grape]